MSEIVAITENVRVMMTLMILLRRCLEFYLSMCVPFYDHLYGVLNSCK